MTPEAPLPTRERWQPLRLGLVDLFYYAQEEFAFRDGRLLLRGNNGTGKSKVLALTLPFLLDGDLSAHRVEPDADPAKRMEWNLLLGGEHPHDERLGYAWLEFGRAGTSGAEFCTIGCGMKAVKGRGIAQHWFFVTDQRIGTELALVDATGIALTADRLEQAIGIRGAVHRRAREYRRAIDERLFGLGERYGALIDLLIKIRAPQLSRRPDEKGLSAALTGALPPLDQALLSDVAEAFRALEDDAAQLVAMVEARDAADRYLATYRAYTRMATRRRAAPVRQTQTVYERVRRELGEAQEARERAQTELKAAETALEALRSDRVRLDARRETLRADPAARSAAELRRTTEAAEQAERLEHDAGEAFKRMAKREQDVRGRLAEAETETADAAAAALSAREAVDAEATAALLESEVTEALSADEEPRMRARAADALERRYAGTRRVRDLLDGVERASATLAAARTATAQLASKHAEATTVHHDAEKLLSERGAGYVRKARAAIDAAREVTLPDAAGAFAALEGWIEALAGENPLQSAASAAGRDAARRLERARADADGDTRRLRAQVEELDTQVAELEAGQAPPPPAPHTRDSASREGRAGAPLWRLVEFAGEVDPDTRAGVEAALEAAGILDGWVTPAGTLIDPATEDIVLSPVAAALTGPRLSELLVPAPAGAAVAEPEIRALIDSIGLGESDATAWVTSGGRFRNGVLSGTWRKPQATFIGAAAREAARLARIAALTEQRDGLRAQLEAVAATLAALAEREATLERELEALPSDAPVREAATAVSASDAALRAVSGQLEAARNAETCAYEGEQAARDLLATDAADLGLPADAAALAEVEAALGRLRVRLAELWPAIAREARARANVERASDDVRGATDERAGAARRLEEAERHLSDARERRDTIRETEGAAIRELERRLDEVERAIKANDDGQRNAESRVRKADRADGAAETLLGELDAQLAEATKRRQDATEGLRRFASTGLIGVATPELAVPDAEQEWTVTATLRLAREIEQALSSDGEDDARWQRLQRQTTDELGALADALRRHGNNAAATFVEDGIVVEVTFRGHTTGLPELHDALVAEVAERERLLDAREREILENHLVGEVASTLQELIFAAERRVAETNEELAARPTSTGMRLRLRWVPDPHGPEGLAGARARLLRQTSDAWSPEDRAAVGAFLQNEIKSVRAQDPSGPWLEHLTRALDYRGWHRFTVERWQAGGWHPASGPSSGGERVLAASVPLFAAASSYYSSAASPHAPRLVMLDEAFAGVDDRARAECLGLLAAFDLDVVMTSEREWGCYAEVPGLAIAQLARADGIAAVLVTRWEWDGAERARVANPAAASHGDATSPAATPPDDSQPLWSETLTSA